jgi:hypothetical protein
MWFKIVEAGRVLVAQDRGLDTSLDVWEWSRVKEQWSIGWSRAADKSTNFRTHLGPINAERVPTWFDELLRPGVFQALTGVTRTGRVLTYSNLAVTANGPRTWTVSDVATERRQDTNQRFCQVTALDRKPRVRPVSEIEVYLSAERTATEDIWRTTLIVASLGETVGYREIDSDTRLSTAVLANPSVDGIQVRMDNDVYWISRHALDPLFGFG